MVFKKGDQIRLGKHNTKESNRKHSESIKGEKNHRFGKHTWNYGLTKETNETVRKMGFKRGHIPWNKNLTKETDLRVAEIAEGNKGRHYHTEESKRKIGIKNKEHRHSEETRKKMSIHSSMYRPEVRAKVFQNSNPSKIVIKTATYLESLGFKRGLDRRREEGLAFPILGSGDFYICVLFEGREMDLPFPKQKIDVECDGDYWHNLPRAKARDIERDEYLKSKGWAVVRLTETEINEGNFEKINNLNCLTPLLTTPCAPSNEVN